MAIPSQFIDELLARCDIVDVISDYVSLSLKGGSYWGLCPFHGERTPSFHVLADRQMYHCFGCSKGGGVISFVMEVENLPYPEAVRLLAKRVGMEFPEEGNDQSRKRRARLLQLSKDAARFFHGKLYEQAGEAGLAYLQSRGLTKATITRFGLGFAPDSWDGLLSAMGALGYEKSELIEAGLAVSGQKGRIYDRFRGRVMFPIIDLRGDVIGFGGRILGEGTPKYLNSPDSMIFNKSQNLFALNLAKNTKLGRIVLTEGYMDTIALYQAGFDCAVASLGTAFTPQHARHLSRFTQEVLIAYDADEAGMAAAKRAIPLLEKAGLKVKVLQMTGAKDPDEYIKNFGRDRFAQLMDQSEDHIEFLLAQIQGKYNLNEDSQKISFAREAAESLSTLASPVEREVYAGRVAEAAGVDKAAILQEIQRAFQRKAKKEKQKQARKDHLPTQLVQPKFRELRYENMRSARAEEGIVRLLMLDESLLEEAGQIQSERFSSPFLGKIFELILRRHKEQLSIKLGALAEELSPDELSHLAAVLAKPEALHRGKQALQEYWHTVEREAISKAGEESDDSLRMVQEALKKIKGMGDV